MGHRGESQQRRNGLRTGSVGPTDRYLRLAFRAQSQCRATIETLAVLKNPTTVFARQANIAHGPQQVNNTQVNTAVGSEETQVPMGPDDAPEAPRARGQFWANQTITVRAWTPEARAQQATAIQRWRPWEQATGPRTPGGKARVARNGYRGGQRRRERVMMRALRAGLEVQQDALGRFARTVNRDDQ